MDINKTQMHDEMAMEEALAPYTMIRGRGERPAFTDGPYLETKEHIGGFWILETANLDDALAWGRKAVVACRASVEVRPFY